jgi:hypothetical protein
MPSMKIPSANQLLFTFVPSTLILLAVAVGSTFFQVDMRTLTSDVATVAGVHPLSGFLSNLGILLWCATASICIFAAMILGSVKREEVFWFLLSSALLSAYLLFDDLFMFHEDLAHRYLGLSEKIVFICLGIVTFAYLIRFSRLILRMNFSVLLLALGFLGTAALVEVTIELWLIERLAQWEYFLEDGFKWMGIVCWCSYYVHTSYQFLCQFLFPDNQFSRKRPKANRQ